MRKTDQLYDILAGSPGYWIGVGAGLATALELIDLAEKLPKNEQRQAIIGAIYSCQKDSQEAFLETRKG